MSDRRVQVVIPIKSLSACKSRLAPIVDPHWRALLSLLMLDRVIAAAWGCPATGEVVVVGGDAPVAAICSDLNVRWEPDPTGDLNTALEAARLDSCRRGWPAMLFLAGDLPRVDRVDVAGLVAAWDGQCPDGSSPVSADPRSGAGADRRVRPCPTEEDDGRRYSVESGRPEAGPWERGAPRGYPARPYIPRNAKRARRPRSQEGRETSIPTPVNTEERGGHTGRPLADVPGALVLAPALRGGTNAILVPHGLEFRFQLGTDSLRRHRVQARDLGVDWRMFRSAGTEWDVDEPEDLARLECDEPEIWRQAARMERFLTGSPAATEGVG